jgi:hypothetical protein
VSVPLAAILGDRLTFDTGLGNDALLLDFNNGVLNKQIDYQGGTGHDAIRVSGGTWSDVSLVMSQPKDITFTGTHAQGTTQITWTNIEEVDELTAPSTKTWRSTSTANLTLLDNGEPNDNVLTLLAGFETYINFAQPTQNLNFETIGGSDVVIGFDSRTPLNFNWNGATNNRFRLIGNLNLHGGSLDASFGEKMFINGNIISSGGTVKLDAQGTGELLFQGQIDVSNPLPGGVGGEVYLLGNQVTAFSNSGVNASGAAGGGRIFIGGSAGGLDRSLTHSQLTIVESDTTFTADALNSGQGGTIVVWSDGSNYVLGSEGLSARGGAIAGNGGLIETGARRVLQVGDAANASAPNGVAGTWRIQARDLVVDTLNPTTLGPEGLLLPSIENTIIPGSVITSALNAGTSVSLVAVPGNNQVGNILVNQSLAVTSAGTPVSLSLTAANDVFLNAPISTNNRPLNVNVSAENTIRNSASGGIFVLPGVGFVELRAGSTIGEANQPLNLAGGLLSSFSQGEQYLFTPSRIDVLQINAANALTYLTGGEFHLLNGTTTSLVLQNTAVLSGAGTMQSLNAEAGSVIRPGDAIGDIGVFQIIGTLDIATGAILQMDINPPYVTAGVDYDQLIVGTQAFLNSSTLQLNGGAEVVKAIKPIILINVLNPRVATLGRFADGQGSLDTSGEVHVGVVITRVFYNGNDGNDVILRNTNVVPGWGAMRPPDPILRPVAEQRSTPLPLASASVSAGRALEEAPPRELDTKQIRVRVLVISRLVPSPTGKGFQEQQLLKLNEEWLKNLADVFRRLPDDRYRVTLVLEGGESRRVMDVIIREGRPFETETADPETATPPTAPQGSSSQVEPPTIAPAVAVEMETAFQADTVETSASFARWLPALAFSAVYLQSRASPAETPAAGAKPSRPFWRWVARSAAEL